MPTSYKQMVDECAEIIDKGVFDEWQTGFLKSVKKQIRVYGERSLTPPQKLKIEDCYDAACRSPY